jgi:hypothetical protein
LKQKDLKFEASMGYIRPFLKKKKKEKKKIKKEVKEKQIFSKIDKN